MAHQEELRLILKTIAETRGADQTREALRQVRQETAGAELQNRRHAVSIKASELANRELAASLRGTALAARQAAQATQSAGVAIRNSSTPASAMSMGQFAAAAIGVGTAAVVAAGAVAGLKAIIEGSVQAASEAVRQQRTLAATYGSNADQINRLAVALRAVGVAQGEVVESAITTDTLIKNYGLTIQQVQMLITRTNDLAVAQGRDLPDAVKRVSDAIRGEAEASEALGLTLNREFLAEQRRKQGLAGTFDQLSQNQRSQIAYNEFLKQSEQFTGQAAKATGELDGSMRQLDAATKELSVSLGKLFGPTVVGGANRLTGIARGLDEVLGRLRELGKAMDDPKIQLVLGAAGALGAGNIPGRIVRSAGPAPFQPAGAALSPVELDAARQPSASDRTAFEANARAERARVERESRRLLALNENLPTQSAERGFAQIAFLDQRDAAIRDVIQSEQEARDIVAETVRLRSEEARLVLDILPQRQAIVDLERQITDQVDRRLQLQQEARRIDAEQRAAPAQNALEDTQNEVARARLVLADRRNQTPEDRLAARQTLRNATRNVLPGQELAAFDANQDIRSVEREQRATDLANRAAQNPLQQRQAALQGAIGPQERGILSIQQSIERQEALANISAARVDAQQRVLGDILQKAIDDGFVKAKITIPIQINVTNPDGSVTVIDDLYEANGAAQTPAVIKLSGVR